MKRIINTLAATGLFLSSFTWLGAIPARAVTADELCVYTGLGTGFQDDTSWSGCTELSAGDSIELPASAVSGGDKTINNTNPNFNIKNIVFTGAFTTTANNYIFTGESISLTGDITASTATGTPTHTVGNMIKLGGASSQNFTLGTQNLTLDKLDLGTKGASISGTGVLEVSGVISGSGELASSIAALRLLGVNTFTGAVNVTGGTLIVGNKDALGSTSAGTKIDTGAKLQLNMGTTAITNAEPFTFTGASTSGSAPKILLNQTATTSGQELKSGPYYTLSGAITITDDVKTGNSNNYVGYYIDLKLTGALSGAGKKFTVSEGLDFELNVAGSANTTSTVNKTYRSNPFNANLSDSGTGTAW